MWRQVGKLIVDENGVALRGLLVRHLVLPNNLSQSEEVIKYLAEEVSPDIAISLMSQYYPAHKAPFDKRINRPITAKEYQKALDALDESKISEGYVQEISSHLHYRPDFSKNGNPFEGN
jgi:putative pyruvate formate lyase activating enzyme